MAGRSVRIFLADGSPQGLRTAEVGMWTGQALVAPRTELERLGKRKEIRRTGVYVLVGPAEDTGFETAVYVGEGDDVWARIASHDVKKDFWTWVVVFVSKDENLTKAHVRRLESRMVEDIRAAKVVQVMNANDPPRGTLPEAEEADMETFIENIRLLLPVLGLNAFASVTGRIEDAEAGGLQLHLDWDTARAQCIVKDGAFIVQKGSTARTKNVDSLSGSYKAMRKRLVDSGVLGTLTNELLVFQQDYSFDSPTAAAIAVTGTNLNGRDKWQVIGSDLTYKEWQEQQIASDAGT